MKKEIKRTPITYNGEDGFEVLYQDTEIWISDSCDYCMYQEWTDCTECVASCVDVHGCIFGKPTYFQFIK